ncbi:MAG: DUF87 domain-containing protein [Litorimonas sp.]
MPNPFIEPITILGQTKGRGLPVQFGMYQPDRLFHTLVLGQTGTGKSTFLLSMMKQDAKADRGFMLLDPHGDLALAVKPSLPQDAIYWDVADPTCPYGYNPLTYVTQRYCPLVASAVLDALKQQWSDAWGVRMEHLLRFALLALLSRKGSSLSDIVPMFTDKAFRRVVLQSVNDPQVLAFWNDEYAKMNYKNAFDGVAPIANKLGAFLSNPVVRKALCEPEQSFRLRELMDSGRPLVINLAKGRLGSDVSDVLGGLMLSLVSSAGFTRADVPEHNRRPFYVYADEFHNFTTGTLASMLSELRKFRVGLILSGQFLSQSNKDVLDAIFGNVGTFVIFRCGVQDAPQLARLLELRSSADLIGLPNYRCFIRLMIDGVQSKAFSAQSLDQCFHL